LGFEIWRYTGIIVAIYLKILPQTASLTSVNHLPLTKMLKIPKPPKRQTRLGIQPPQLLSVKRSRPMASAQKGVFKKLAIAFGTRESHHTTMPKNTIMSAAAAHPHQLRHIGTV
jgi:hypothetical protein